MTFAKNSARSSGMSLEIIIRPPARSICFFNLFSFVFIERLLNTEAPSECGEEQVFYTRWNATARF